MKELKKELETSVRDADVVKEKHAREIETLTNKLKEREAEGVRRADSRTHKTRNGVVYRSWS